MFAGSVPTSAHDEGGMWPVVVEIKGLGGEGLRALVRRGEPVFGYICGPVCLYWPMPSHDWLGDGSPLLAPCFFCFSEVCGGQGAPFTLEKDRAQGVRFVGDFNCNCTVLLRSPYTVKCRGVLGRG